MRYFNQRLLSSKHALIRRLNLPSPAIVRPHFRADDRFLVSYPKSGNTFLRFLVASVIADKAVDFVTVDRYATDIYKVSARFLEALSSPRLMKSHELQNHVYKNVYYLVRDPRQVAMSYAFWANRTLTDDEVLINIDKIIIHWLERDDGFMNWVRHTEGWLHVLKCPNPRQRVRFCKYEDLIDNTHRTLIDVLNFFNISHSSDSVERAVANCGRTQMKAGELAAKPFFCRRIRPFVRTGKRPSLQEAVSSDVLRQFQDKLGQTMAKIDYHWA